ncbi:MAG: hypothetical protein ABFR75_10455 [Acidobacteriota bacterium]
MKKNIIAASLIFMFLISGASFLFSTEKEKQKDDAYLQLYKKIVSLYRAKKFEETRNLLEKNIGNYPEKFDRFAYNLSIIYGHTKEFEKGIKILNKAHKKGVWFNILIFKSPLYKGYKDLPGFKAVLSKNNELYEKAKKDTKSKMDISLPENFDKSKKYPLFIALHGGGENIKNFKPRWTSEKMKNEYIVAYLQSSQLIAPDGYGWENYFITKKEVKSAFEKILEKYPVDKKRIIIGGFSSGGGASLFLTFKEKIPVKGFIILCPQVPKEIVEPDVLKAAKKGIRGTFITTERDNRLELQKKLVGIFKRSGLGHKFVIFPNTGHWYPEGLDKKIDEALEHIFKK